MGMGPESVAEVMDLIIARGLLAELGMKMPHARTIQARNSIPPHWHLRIADLAKRHGLPIDLALLARLAADRRGPRREQPAAAGAAQ
jgi:hypothetical protein